MSVRYHYPERCPFYYKSQLEQWAEDYFKGEKPSKFRSMNKDQLQAIWYNVQRKQQRR